jgi:signal-transduction protein with cAMP-binding, CBS, and nucleotidyltransferase domain
LKTAADILAAKQVRLLTIDAGVSVLEAARQMIEANVGSMLVTVEGEITGIVTERDYLRRVVLEEKGDRETTVGEIMTAPLIVVTPETSVDECMSIITERRIRHLPVAEGRGEVIGLISIGDVVKFNSTQQSAQIRYLTDYINAR